MAAGDERVLDHITEKNNLTEFSEDFSGSSGSEYIPDSDSSVESVDIRPQILSSECRVENTQEKKSRKRKRLGSAQEVNKKQRNKGNEYKKYRGKGEKVQEKKPGPPCQCSKRCFELISEDKRNELFRSFWNLSNYDIQNVYLRGCTHSKDIKRKRSKQESMRSQTIEYTIKFNGKDLVICKTAFLNLHGLQNNRGRVENIVKKLKQCVADVSDGRGKHSNHPTKYTTGNIERVKEFIDKLPRYISHYSRKDSSKEYMPMGYSIQLCFEKYVEECKSRNENPVSVDKFRRIFTEDYNISFKSPKSDTCQRCDSLAVAIKHSKDTDEVKSLELQKELHQRQADAGQNEISKATKEANENNNIHVITFDLQQTLPTPKLTTGPMFYKRKLWCYNLSVHSCGDNQGFFFLWDEATAKRGSDEVASCLKLYFENNDIKGEKLIAISDNCGGQNKNWTLVSFWFYLLSTGRFKEIEHVFPQVGHTMLPSDRDFALVEKHVSSHYQMVYGPEHWEEVLKTSQKKRPFNVTRMHQENFFDFSALKKKIQQEKVSKSQFSIRNCVRLKFTTNSLHSDLRIFFSNTYSGDMQEISLARRGRPGNISRFIDVERKYLEPLPIKAEKLKDVLLYSGYRQFITNDTRISKRYQTSEINKLKM